MVTAAHRDDIACGAGCTACCRQDLTVCTIERDHIAAYLAEHGLEPRDESRTDQDRHPLFERLQGGVPCAFLGPQGRCSIYEARPLICRTHGLPIVVEETVGTCALNFQGHAERGEFEDLPANHKLDLDLLNTTLAVIERLYAEGRGVEPSRESLLELRRRVESV
jgi:Fe-S-cluster containining protein